jgi:hypothetical protein
MTEEEHKPEDIKVNGIPGQEQNYKRRNKSDIKIVGYNLLVLIIYTILCKLGNDLGGLMFDAFLVGSHVIICFILAAVNRNLIWLLSGIMVLVIGFSTCVYLGFGGL